MFDLNNPGRSATDPHMMGYDEATETGSDRGLCQEPCLEPPMIVLGPTQ